MPSLCAVFKNFNLACLLIFCGSATAANDFWGFQYETSGQNVAVLHLMISAGRRTIYKQYSFKPDGEPTRYHSESYSGPMPRPDSLYVQWIEEKSGLIHEERMDLRALPPSLEDTKLTLMLRGSQALLFAVHMAVPTDRPLKEVDAKQVFPDPSLMPYRGVDRPKSYYNPD